jgi:hypothetical protein
MAKINLTEEVLKHSDDEIIEYLSNVSKGIRSAFRRAIESDDPNLLYITHTDVEIITTILAALDRRNKERGL